MAKIVVETVQVIKNRYFIETDNVEWAGDDVTCGGLEPYQTTVIDESIISAKEVERWRDAGPMIGFKSDKSQMKSVYYTYDGDKLHRRLSSLMILD